MSAATNRLGISKEELEVIKEAFMLFDGNADGYLQPNELGGLLQALGVDIKTEDMVRLINDADKKQKSITLESILDIIQYKFVYKNNY